jgi:hypothetical protein
MGGVVGGWPYITPTDHPKEYPAHSQALAAKLLAVDTPVSWSPALTGFTASAIDCTYRRTPGGLLTFHAQFTIIAVTGPLSFTLPVPVTKQSNGVAHFGTAGGSFVGMSHTAAGSSSCSVLAHSVSGTYMRLANMGPTVPIAWAVGDKITVTHTAQCAPTP